MNRFSLKKAVIVAWSIIKRDFPTLTMAGVGLGAFQAIVLVLFPGETDPAKIFDSPAVTNLVIQNVATLTFVYALTAISLSMRRGLSIWSLSRWKIHIMLKVMVATLLFYIGAFLGLVAIIIPGLMFIAAYSMFEYVIFDKEVGILDSFRESSHITKGVRLKILGLFIATCVVVYGTLFLINSLVGIALLLPPLLSTLVTWSLYYIIGIAICLVSADIYLQLQKSA